ncbi:MAG: hypothetical protein OXG52_09455, partial [bacterium]|nr:hypothetical protein [bacterium]
LALPRRDHRSDRRPAPAARRAPTPTSRRGDRGAVELELVIVVPVLMMIVLFVVWAGRVGNAGLAAELAAEEAAVAAALADEDRREQVAAEILALRPDLDYLCVDGPTPAGGDKYVTEVQRDFAADQGVSRTIGLVGVALRCETDGAVPVLQGLAPTVVHYGRGSEPYVLALRSELPTVLLRDISVFEGPERDEYQAELRFTAAPIEIALSQPVVGDSVRLVANTAPIDAVGGPSVGRGGCESSPDDHHYYDYRNTSYSAVIPPGEQRIRFAITIIDDCIDENDERFTVHVEAEGAVFENGSDESSFTVTIIDTDPAPLIGFVKPSNDDTDGRMCDESGEYLLKEKPGPTQDSPKGECDLLDLNIELRDPFRPDVRVRTGRDVSFSIISRGAEFDNTLTAFDNSEPPPPKECSVADFNEFTTRVSVSPLPTTFANQMHRDEHSDPKDAVPQYNLFDAQSYPELRWENSSDSHIFDDRADEPRYETFRLMLSDLNAVDAAPTKPHDQAPDFAPTVAIKIVDDDPPVRLVIEPPDIGRSSVTRGEFEDDSFALPAASMIDVTSPSASEFSQAMLTYDFAVSLEFRDGSTVDDEKLGDQIPPCDPNRRPGLLNLEDQVQIFADAHSHSIDDLTRIEFKLSSSQPCAEPGTLEGLCEGAGAGWGADPLFTTSQDTWTLDITDGP